jgi:hypothetical protein
LTRVSREPGARAASGKRRSDGTSKVKVLTCFVFLKYRGTMHMQLIYLFREGRKKQVLLVPLGNIIHGAWTVGWDEVVLLPH